LPTLNAPSQRSTGSIAMSDDPSAPRSPAYVARVRALCEQYKIPVPERLAGVSPDPTVSQETELPEDAADQVMHRVNEIFRLYGSTNIRIVQASLAVALARTYKGDNGDAVRDLAQRIDVFAYESAHGRDPEAEREALWKIIMHLLPASDADRKPQ
jgi:hypothetical protein